MPRMVAKNDLERIDRFAEATETHRYEPALVAETLSLFVIDPEQEVR